MDWSDIFDGIFGGGGDTYHGSGQAKLWSFGITETTRPVPIVGSYYGTLLTGYDDLTDLTNPVGDDDEPRKQYYGEFDQLFPGPHDAGRGSSRRELLKNPNLLADNSDNTIVRGEDGIDYSAGWYFGEGRPDEESIPTVTIHGTRPDRTGQRGSHAPRHGRPVHLDVPKPWNDYEGPGRIEQSGAYRPERERAPTPELQVPPQPELSTPDEPLGFIGPNPTYELSETIISVEPAAERLAKEKAWNQYQERLRRMGRIELSDLGQFGRGLFNGVIGAAQEALRVSKMRLPGGTGIVGTFVLDQADPIKDSLIGGLESYRLPTDPVFGGGAIIGEHLSTNLVFEGLPFISKLGPFARRALASTKSAALAPVFMALGAGMSGGSSFRAASALTRAGATPARAARGTVRITELGRVSEITTRRGFRRYVIETIKNDASHPLNKLIDPATGRLRPSTQKGITALDWFENPDIIEAGHFRSAKFLEGTADSFVIMSAYENRLASAMIEHPRVGGVMLESGLAVSIGGLPVDLRTAEALVEANIVTREALEAAPLIIFDVPPISIY